MKALLLTGLVMTLIAGCAQRAPTLPPLTKEEVGDIKKAEDWKDWGPEENQKQRESALEGTRLSSEEITATFRGRVLRGCYPNGEKFAETLGSDGKFYDAMNNNAELGQWGVQNALLCFRYPERKQAGEPDSCFIVMKAGSRFDFYTADAASKVASTACPQ